MERRDFLNFLLRRGPAPETTTGADSLPRPLLRSGAPVNASGEPFGHAVSGIAAIPWGVENSSRFRLLLVTGHAGSQLLRRSCGVSVLELARGEKGWTHDVSSPRNRRWHLETPVPVHAGERVFESPGVGAIHAVCPTPWGTALCAEAPEGAGDGWVLEVDPVSGTAVKRLSLGGLTPRSISVEALSGKPARVRVSGVEASIASLQGTMEFLSRGLFDSRDTRANRALLSDCAEPRRIEGEAADAATSDPLFWIETSGQDSILMTQVKVARASARPS